MYVEDHKINRLNFIYYYAQYFYQPEPPSLGTSLLGGLQHF